MLVQWVVCEGQEHSEPHCQSVLQDYWCPAEGLVLPVEGTGGSESQRDH